jgi:hypothetical protein
MDYECIVVGVGNVTPAVHAVLMTGRAVDVVAGTPVRAIAPWARDLVRVPRAWAFVIPLAGPPCEGDWYAADRALAAGHVAQPQGEAENYARDGVYAYAFQRAQTQGLYIPGGAS